MSNKVHNDRVRVLKGKVDKLNSGEWENDDRVVLPKERQRRRRHRHYEMERDGKGGFRRVKTNPSKSEGFKLEVFILLGLTRNKTLNKYTTLTIYLSVNTLDRFSLLFFNSISL